MFLYKLKKLVKEKRYELIVGSLQLAMIASFVSQFFLLFISSQEFSKREKLQMFFASLTLTAINLFTINLVGEYFDIGVLFSIFAGIGINFLIYIFPSLIFIIITEWSDISLTKDEIREAKLNRVLRKLF